MENKNILLAAMSLDIGGAETHVFELAKELSARGHNVVVASNGGAYASQLEQCGIRHVCLPLHRKSPVGMCRAYFGLLKLTSEQKTEVIHAHARIPAFLCSLLARVRRLPLVTTCHGQYKTSGIWRYFSLWGDYTLAVSYDIKQYLIDNYSLFSDNISVTVNAIDTERFSGKVEKYQEGPPEENQAAKSILYVGRIDKPAAEPLFHILPVMESLREKFPALTLDIVGSGNMFKELSSQAEKINSRLGEEAIILHGARTDVEKFMQEGGVFVGVSRSALEAMSSGMDILLAGKEGYIGILDQSNLADAFATNFCCRGCGELTEQALYDGLCEILSRSNGEHAAAGRINREIILNNYTSLRMTDDAERVYSLAIKTHPAARSAHGRNGVLISGYYGFGNMGDDSLLQSIISDLRHCKPDIRVTVISKKPRHTAQTYHVDSIKRFNVFSLCREFRRSQLLISGGGSLLTDVTSTRSLLYYSFIIRAAKKCGLKVMLYANGMGPFIREKSRKIARNALIAANIITLREKSSLAEIDLLGVSRENVSVIADPAFGLQKADDGWIEYRMKRYSLDPQSGYFGVSVRSWYEADALFTRNFAAACNKIAEQYNLTPLLLPMQPSKDLKISEDIARLCGGKVIYGLCASEVVSLLAHTEFVIGMRLHSLIYTFSAGRPLIGLSYDPKIDALLAELEYPYRINVSNFSVGALVDYAGEIMRNKDIISADVQKSLAVFKEKARSGAEMAVELAESKQSSPLEEG